MTSLVAYLVRQSYSVTVVSSHPDRWNENQRNSKVPSGIRSIWIKHKDNSFFNASSLFKKAVFAELTLHPYDFVLCSMDPYFEMSWLPSIFQKYGVPYGLEFRDLCAASTWLYLNSFWFGLGFEIVKKCYFKTREKRCISSARFVVAVTPQDTERLKRIYPTYADKMKMITNGYDDQRLLSSGAIAVSTIVPPRMGTLSIAIFGKFSLYYRKYAELLLKACNDLLERGMSVRIVHIGDEEQNEADLLHKTGFPKSNYINTGLVDYATGIALIEQQSIGVIVYKAPTGYGTKIFDYMYANKPIVAICPLDCALANLVMQFENGFICNTSIEIEIILERIYEEKIIRLGSPEQIAPYSRTIQNKKYDELIKKTLLEENK